MSITTQFEELEKEKERLKKILISVEEEEKYLGNRLRVIEEKIAIQVLKEKIKARRAVVDQLKSRLWALEKRMKEPQKAPVASERTETPQKKTPPEVVVKAAPA